ncbi:MAG: hypothetical protein MAGBODY4_00738 [Candidatus Marinimicrobia bacterium]|nr:hypothetical protein [Candidatus Neomarinimicrobiota bacterium]
MFNQSTIATLKSVNPISIHGQRYYDILFVIEEDEEQLQRKSRAPFEEVYENPQPGDKVKINSLLGAITSIEKVEE